MSPKHGSGFNNFIVSSDLISHGLCESTNPADELKSPPKKGMACRTLPQGFSLPFFFLSAISKFDRGKRAPVLPSTTRYNLPFSLDKNISFLLFIYGFYLSFPFTKTSLTSRFLSTCLYMSNSPHPGPVSLLALSVRTECLYFIVTLPKRGNGETMLLLHNKTNCKNQKHGEIALFHHRTFLIGKKNPIIM